MDSSMNSGRSSTAGRYSFTIFAVAVIAAWSAALGISLWGVGPWYDEGITLLELSGNLFAEANNPPIPAYSAESIQHGKVSLMDLIVGLILRDVHPPLHYIFAEMWSWIFSDHLFSFRVFSIASVSIGVLVFATQHKTLSKTGRTFLLLMLCSSIAVIFSAANVRGYGLALSFLLVSLALLHKSTLIDPEHSGPKSNRLFLWGVFFAGLAFLTHYFTIFAFGTAVLYALVFAYKRDKYSAIASMTLSLLFVVLAYPFLKVQLFSRGQQYHGFTDFGSELLGFMVKLASYAVHPGEFIHNGAFISVVWVFAIILTGAILSIKQSKLSPLRFHGFVVVGYIFGLMLLFWVSNKTLSGASSRYVIFAIPSILVCVAAILDSALLQKTRMKFAGVLAAMMLLTINATGSISLISMGRILPWEASHKHDEIRNAFEDIEGLDAVAILPNGYWSGGWLIWAFTGTTDTYIGDDFEYLGRAFDDAKSRKAVMVMESPGWNTDLREFRDAKISELESCGFSSGDNLVWHKSSDVSC